MQEPLKEQSPKQIMEGTYQKWDVKERDYVVFRYIFRWLTSIKSIILILIERYCVIVIESYTFFLTLLATIQEIIYINLCWDLESTNKTNFLPTYSYVYGPISLTIGFSPLSTSSGFVTSNKFALNCRGKGSFTNLSHCDVPSSNRTLCKK